MAPDHKNPNSPIDCAEEDKLAGLGSAILKESSSEAIMERCTMLFNWLRSLTDLISACCKDLSNGESNDDQLSSPVNTVVEELISNSAKDARNLEVSYKYQTRHILHQRCPF